MALKEQDVVLYTTDSDGNNIIQMPITRVENVEGSVKTVNGTTPDTSGNVTISIPTPKAYVTETYTSGTAWYRKYSDGWIEQGGQVSHGNANTGTITYPLAFTQIPTVSLDAIVGVCEVCLSSVGTTSFNWVMNASRSGTNHWIACGN